MPINRLVLNLGDQMRELPSPESLDSPIDISLIKGRPGASGWAYAIPLPPHLRRLVLVVTTPLGMSPLGSIISVLRKRLQADAQLIISVPRTDFFMRLQEMYRDADFEFVIR